MTFKATHEEETGATSGHMASYSVHMDFGTQNVKLIDCILYSENGCAAGIGTHQDERIEFHDCYLESNISSEYWPYAYLPDYGAMFIHSAVNGQDITNQHIVLNNCLVKSTNPLATHAMFLTSIDDKWHFSPHIDATIINCTFKDGATGGAKVRMEFNLNPDSHGNNNTNLNLTYNNPIL